MRTSCTSRRAGGKHSLRERVCPSHGHPMVKRLAADYTKRAAARAQRSSFRWAGASDPPTVTVPETLILHMLHKTQ